VIFQGPGIASGGIRTRGWTSAAANHDGDTRPIAVSICCGQNKVDMAIDAASGEDHSFPSNRLCTQGR